MANKFILIPEDIYRGLLTHPLPETGNINLDFTRENLENIKSQNANTELKNINYNQELRRYLHMLKDQNERPMNVSVRQMDDPAIEQIKKLLPLLQTTSNENRQVTETPQNDFKHNIATPKLSPLNEGGDLNEDDLSMHTAEEESPDSKRKMEPKVSTIKEKTKEIFENMKQENLDKYDVSTDGKILSKKGGKEIQGSNAQKSLECILRTGISGKLRWGELTPPGTSVLESKLKSDNKIWPLIEKARESCTPKRTYSTQKRKIAESKEIAESKWRPPAEWK